MLLHELLDFCCGFCFKHHWYVAAEVQKVKPIHLCSALFAILIPKTLLGLHMLSMITQFRLPLTHLIHQRNEPRLPLLTSAERQHSLAGVISYFIDGGRLSWLAYARKQSSISVLTGLDVEQLY